MPGWLGSYDGIEKAALHTPLAYLSTSNAKRRLNLYTVVDQKGDTRLMRITASDRIGHMTSSSE